MPLGFQVSDHWFHLPSCPLCQVIHRIYVMSSGANKGSHGYLLDYCGFKDTPRADITIISTNIAMVPDSAYTHTGNKYDQTLGRNSISVKSTHLPSSVAEFM